MKTVLKLAVLSTALSALPAYTAVIQVEPGEVASSTNGHCSLIEAIRNAEDLNGIDQSGGDCTAGSGGADVIQLSADSTYTLTASWADSTALPRIRSTVTIEGNGAIIERDTGAGSFRLVLVAGEGSLDISDATLRNGQVSGGGGAIFNHGQLLLDGVVIENSESSGGGGGIHNNGNLTLRNSTIRNSRATTGAGGGLVNRGTLTVERSLIEGNSSSGAGGGLDAGVNTATLLNSTFSGNEADGLGGGIVVTNHGTLDATQVTVAYNAGTQAPDHEDAGLGSGIYQRSGTINLNNTLLAEQTDGNNCGGTITHQSTVADDGSCSVSASADPLIAALASNGGPTLTHALVNLSAAIDNGDDGLVGGLTTDQRDNGYPRLIGAHVDVGAFEFGDTDGLEDDEEDGVPNPGGSGFGDGNGDSIPDSQQSHVASLNTALGGVMATIETSGETRALQDVSPEPVPGDSPANVSFPYGFFSFTITNVGPGATEQVVLYVPHNPDINGYWKKSTSDSWANIATSITQDGNKTRIVFPLTEGGPYDFDADNTTISDPGGPGVFAAATPIPTFSQWGAILLSIMLAVAAMVGMRPRRGN